MLIVAHCSANDRVRETQDHGTFNSWDRQPFMYTGDNGNPTFVPRMNVIGPHNFFVNNYNPQEAVDNDDSSAYYDTHHNFFPFSTGGLKNDFKGHDNSHHHNMYYNAGGCMGDGTTQSVGHEDSFFNNICIMNVDRDYATWAQGDKPIMHDNRVFSPEGKATENGHPIAFWQKEDHDLRTTAAKIPADNMVLAMAREVLGM